MMNIAQVIPCLGRHSGGPSRSVYELSKGLRSIGVESEILTNNYIENPNIASDRWIHSVDISKMLPFEYNAKFKNVLKSRDYELFHIHSIYSYPVTIAARFAKNRGIPYIIAPRGSLYDAALNSSSVWKKRIFNHLFLYSDLQHASAIHATCREEMEQIRELGIKTPIAIIPNSISLPKEMPLIQTPSKFRLCFLGRINPIKNLDGLLKAWHCSGLSNSAEAELVIIGGASLEKERLYLKELHRLEQELQIRNIAWKGNLLGEEKNNVLKSCSFLILPSYSENFGMVVVEALIHGVPVVASKGTPWSILETQGCGWWINNSVEDMGKKIKELLKVSLEKRLDMGYKGQLLVEQKYSTDAVSNALKTLYEWILYNKDKPNFVK